MKSGYKLFHLSKLRPQPSLPDSKTILRITNSIVIRTDLLVNNAIASRPLIEEAASSNYIVEIGGESVGDTCPIGIGEQGGHISTVVGKGAAKRLFIKFKLAYRIRGESGTRAYAYL